MSDGRPPAGHRLCRLDELDDPGARGFGFEAEGEGAWPFRGFVVRVGAQVLGYVDACPHVGAPLDPDGQRYLTRRGDHIVCANHGALFRVDDGLCVGGPCVKRALRPWALAVEAGWVVTA